MRERFHSLVSGQTKGPGAALARLGLRFAAFGYQAGVAIRNQCFDAGWRKVTRVDVPVISVGNLTLGGTGKTPCVEYLARFFRERDVRVAILSRGYGSERGLNDEALVLEENLPDVPHLQGADRAALARTAVEELESELLILDDGFQHRKLARDVDLVLIDATNPWGHGYLFPRGLLREPRRSLRRADAVLLTRCDQVDATQLEAIHGEVRRFALDRPVIETVHRPMAWVQHDRPEQPVETLKGKMAAGFCGIGNPDAFRKTVLERGCQVNDFKVFPDHHAYTRQDVNGLHEWAERLPKGCVLVTTQKDLVKMRIAQLGRSADLFALRIGLEPKPGAELERLEARLGGLIRSTV